MDFYKTHKIEIRFVIGLENMLFADVCVCVCVCAIFSPKCLQARAVKGLIVVLLPVLRRIPQITKIVSQWQLQVQLHVWMLHQHFPWQSQYNVVFCLWEVFTTHTELFLIDLSLFGNHEITFPVGSAVLYILWI